MQNAVAANDNPTLSGVRQRSQGYLAALLWLAAFLCLLWTANATATLVEHWVALLRGMRTAIGLRPPEAGPDYWIIGGVGFLAVAVVCLVLFLYAGYRAAWRRRLRSFWGNAPQAEFVRIEPLQRVAGEEQLRNRTRYLEALLARSTAATPLQPCDDARKSYENAAAAALRLVETDIAQRAVTAGLVVGLNRNPMIDTLTIVASAFELQLHVLTRLGKRPSWHTWLEMLKRTGASIFLNTYVSREDALYLNLAIRKAALGLQMASDSMEDVAGHVADIDWDDVLGHMSVPGLSALTSVATMSMTVGAFGLRQLGAFIEATANDLLQGVLAGGILYYHGMALAADCLALDERHRHTPEMTRTIAQAMTMACTPAGRLLRDQVRRMRQFLRERRSLALAAAKDACKQGVGNLQSKWGNLKEGASGLLDRRQHPS